MAGRHQFDTDGRPILSTTQQVIHGQMTNIQNISGVQQPPMSLPPNAIINQPGMLRHPAQNPIDVIRPGTTSPISIRQSTPNNRPSTTLNSDVLNRSGQNQMIPMLIDNPTNNVPSRPPTPLPSVHSVNMQNRPTPVPQVNQIFGRPHNVVPATTSRSNSPSLIQQYGVMINSANRSQAGKILPRSMQRPKMLEMPKPKLTLKAEFVITPSSIVGKKKLNVMRIKGQKVDLTKLNAPVKLHRRDPEAPSQNGGINNRQNQSIIPGNKSVQILPPTTGTADASLIAPYAGARQNKKNLFKKKTTQVFLADPKSRELKAEESIPWVLEDFGGENTFVGDYIGGDSAKYCILLRQGDKFRVVPVHRFYEFQRKLKIRTLTIEEAEEQMARAKKMDNDRWLMRRFGKGKETEDVAENEGGIYDPKSSIRTVEGEDDLHGSGDERRPAREEYEEEMDYDEVFEDDDEGVPDDANPLFDEETKEVGKLKAKVKHPFEINDPSLSDNGDELTTEGKQMKKLIRELDDNDAYESDRESNPYASESDEFESEENSSPASKSPPATGSTTTTPSAKTEKPMEKGKGLATKSKMTGKLIAAKSKAPTGSKIKSVEKTPKLKAAAKQKLAAPKQNPPMKGKGAIPVSANVAITSSKIKTPDGAIKQFGDATTKTLAKETIQKPKLVNPASSSSTLAATPNVVGRPKTTSLTSGKRSLPGDSTSEPVKRARVDTQSTRPIENKKSIKSTIKREDEVRPVPPESVKKQKVSTKVSTVGDSLPSNSRGSLISEDEIRNLIVTKKVKVPDLILHFKNRIKEDSRNKDRLISITKEIATYKGDYLVLKSS
ncbi:11758_t:CDS:2 [Acaulospora colombiana]|uniref:11758_t:CDS:1 n=1 Tax=Acaulospora colombiana TaxID=27376 RepID=A0ACA9N4Y4_9GLOM|nr:11758_t:CDS:2 [Acaulospora colombiana]